MCSMLLMSFWSDSYLENFYFPILSQIHMHCDRTANSYHTAYKKTSLLPFLIEQRLSCLSSLPRFPPCNGLCQADSTNKYQLLMASLSPSLKYQPHWIALENHSKSLFFLHSQLRFLSIMKLKKIIRRKKTHPFYLFSYSNHFEYGPECPNENQISHSFLTIKSELVKIVCFKAYWLKVHIK